MNLSKTFVTSDTHYGHSKVIKYSNRPFKDVDEMNEVLISNWNSLVSDKDLIFHLGDFAFGEPGKYLKRLRGKIIFLPGNHDIQLLKNKNLFDRFENAALLHEASKNINGVRFNLTADIPYDNGNPRGGLIVMNHYANLVWNKSHYGAIHLHGHSHGTLKYPRVMRAMDVGVDPMNYFPISLSDVILAMDKIDFSENTV